MSMSFNAIQNVILIFPDERPVFLREANNNMYSVSAYFWAKIYSEFPSSVLTPTIFGSICYYLIGFSTVFWYKFPTFRKSKYIFLLLFFSVDPFLDLQRIWRLRIDPRNYFLRQITCSHVDSSVDYSLHALRRLFRELELDP